MSTARSTFGEVLTLIGDAMAVAAAVRQGRQPSANRLARLGIDPEQFRSIRRF